MTAWRVMTARRAALAAVVVAVVAAGLAAPAAAGTFTVDQGHTPGPAPALRPHGSAPVPNGCPSFARGHVRAWFEWRGRRRLSVTVPPGVRVRIRGRVTDPHGRGIAGAALALIETVHGRRRAATGVRTRPDGRFTAFTYIGPSRTLRFVYHPYAGSAPPRRGPLLRLRVRRPPHDPGPRTVTPRTPGGA